MSHPPTREQQAAIDIARTGESCVIEALAGTGKTTTLGRVAEAMPTRNVTYVAFNKAIVEEAKTKMPGNTTCVTAHGLAFRTKGRLYKHRLNGARMRSDEISRILRCQPFEIKMLGTSKRMAHGWIAGQVRKTIDVFCQTGDPEPRASLHMPMVPGIDEPRTMPDGTTRNVRGPNHRALEAVIDSYLARAWADIANPNGQLPFTHNHYLKLWQLDGPDIYADTILYDEAQDANGCMLAIVNSQSAQKVFVGDTYQQIYAWNGAVNALGLAEPDAPRCHLTESFRFGPEIAMFANKALEWLQAPVELKGRATGAEFVGVIMKPDAILFRTNAAAVGEALRILADGRKPALVGGAKDVVEFAKAAVQLKAGVKTYHPELACFDTWVEVQDYVEHDPAGSELQALVKLVDDYGPDVIIDGLGQCVDERYADVVLSTAHKAKGREWESVQLWGDYPDPAERDISDEDVRLLYVAATRAKRMLDPTRVGFFDFQREMK